MKRQAILGWVVVLCALLGMCASTSRAQAVYGSIIGTVTDAQGNAVSGAKVTVTSLTKNTSEETTTNESGNYSVLHLIPDTYKVAIEAPGFKVTSIPSVIVEVDAASSVDAQLQVGAVTQTVEVTTEVPQLKTDRADVALDFNSEYVEKLPLVNRNFQSLLLAAPGTQQIGWGHAATENPQGSQQTFVMGQHFSGTGYELDGTDNQDPILGIIIINPNLDSVEEAKISLLNYDAEFGKSVAGLVVASTKSGTNDFHGSAFWFRNSDATQARNPFTQSPAQAPRLPSAKWNQFGGFVGGPVIKNKLFFFADYQGTRQANGVTDQITIPTSKVLSTCTAATGNCDLSEYAKNISGGQIYDPATGYPNTGAGRTAFPNLLIPVGRLSPVAVKLLKLFPQPVNGNTTAPNFFGSGSGPFHGNSFDVRGDYQASGGLHIFGRYTRAYYGLNGQPVLGIGLGGQGTGIGGLSGSSIIHNHSLAAGFDKAISTTLLTDFRFGWFKYNPHSIKPDATTAAAEALGLHGLNTADTSTGGLPAFQFDNDARTLTNFGDGLDPSRCNCPLVENEHQYQFVNNWTKISGNHEMKFGADLRFAHNLRFPSDANRTGQLVFSHKQTSLYDPVAGSNTGGLDLASFLLGQVSKFERFASVSQTASESQKRFFLYAQDKFRITPKLTVNYGIRWEDYLPESVNAKGNGGFANIDRDGFIRVGGYGPYGLNGSIRNYLGAFGPRVGIAYQVRTKTVVRLGYGRSYDIGVFGSNFGHAVTQNLPVLVHQSIQAHDLNPAAINDNVPVYQMDSATGPPPASFPAISASGTIPLRGWDNSVDPRIRPSVQRPASLDMWNATVQHQLTSTITVEVAYIGNKGTHGFAGNGPAYNANPRSMVGYGVAGLNPDTRRPFFNHFSYLTTDPVTGKPVALMCCSSDLGNYFGMDASSNYHALQLKAEKRFSHGLQFVSHYTWSRARFYDGNYFAIDPKIAYGPMNVNRNHVWITNVVYEIPVGRGKRFMTDANKWIDYAIGGWRVTSITNWSGGLPWTPGYKNCGNDQDVGVCRPNRASGSFKLGPQNVTDPITGQVFLNWFVPVPELTTNGATGGSFARPAAGTLGNIGLDSFRGPRLFTSDMSLAKNFRFTERFNAEFRVDARNVFNHPVLGFSYAQGNLCIDCSVAAGASPTDAGRITDIDRNSSMRLLTFGLRFSF
ncbi:MAG TPA: carboxypeptidase regulatory-like domain-containing protein [Candidatus Dormibacteraeota bacterium]|nr:carboxypeptidase regulatory-like domain-containing protein [Candidatus Dormibacteraeota bacterium]